MFKRTLRGVVMLMVLAVGPALAQQFPTKPITLICPWPAGGSSDLVMRAFAESVGKQLGQTVIIENRPGASGTMGAGALTNARPDGYTLTQLPISVFRLPLMQKTPFDPFKDITYIINVTGYTFGLVVRADAPWKDLKEFVAYAKANQAKMQYGSAGGGSGMHVCAVLLDVAMGTKITHVPYRGAGPAMQDLIGGRIDYIAEQISTALPQIQGNSVKAIATLGLDRAPGLENLPTAEETGLKGLDCGSWGALSFPKGTPDAIVRRLAKASNDAVETPALRERYRSIGVTIPVAERRTPEYLAKFVPSEIARWAGPIKASGASVD